MHAFLLAICLSLLPPGELLLDTNQIEGLDDALMVDTRDRGAFEAGHIPGAAHLDVETLSEMRDGVPGMLKPESELSALLAEAGVDPRKHVVVYSGHAQADDVKRATRLFWILEHLGYERVSLLNGGFAKWASEDRPVGRGAPEPRAVPVEKVRVQTPMRAGRLATRENVLDMIAGNGEGTLVDCRIPEHYAGLEKSPAVESAGHIPGATNVPALSLFDGPHHEFKTGAALDEALEALDLAPDSDVIAYCNTGRDATIGYFGLRLAGADQVRMYDGSMAEWSRLERLRAE